MKQVREPKKTKERLSNPYRLRLPIPVVEQYENLAQQSNKSMSFVLRQVLTEKSKKVCIQRDDTELKTLMAQRIRLLSNTGNNINQIAKHLNTLKNRNELSAESAIHYLRILETIEFRLYCILGKEQKNAR